MSKCIKCGSYAFNLYKEDIDQGGLCDVHYWQYRAHRAEALAQQPARPYRLLQDNGSKYFGESWDKAEQPAQQEPVAWMWRCKPYCNWPEWNVSLQRPADSGCDGNKRTEGYEDIPLYNAPQPQRQPQQEPVAWRTFDGEGGYEYRSYEMNEQYAQEWEQRNPKHKGWVEPLYTTPPPCPTCEALARTVMMDQTGRDTSPPPQRKPLTDKEIADIATSHPLTWVNLNTVEHRRYFARAIEAAHGVKENK